MANQTVCVGSEPFKLSNPLTPMAWLAPSLAMQATLREYVAVGSCAVIAWDVVDNLRNDYRLLKRYRLRLPTVVYFMARFGVLGYTLSATIFATADVTTSCASFAKVVAAFYPICVSSTSLLFFFRLKAVFSDMRRVVALFLIIWLSLLVSTIIYPFGPVGHNIGPTGYCTVGAPQFGVAPIMISLVYDTLTLFAVSWKLMANTHIHHDIQTGVRTMVRGDYLPAFSRALLQDAQLYYMVTLPFNLLSAILFCVKFVPPTLRVMMLVPTNVIINIMACRVFRNTKFGLIPESPSSSRENDVMLHRRSKEGPPTLPIAFKPPSLSCPSAAFTTSGVQLRSVTDSVVVVHITTIIERETSPTVENHRDSGMELQ